MVKRYSIVLAFPILIQTTLILLWQSSHTGIFETAYGLSIVLLWLTAGVGLIALIPTLLTQVLVARSLVKSEVSLLSLFLIGMLNPSGAIVTILAMGWVYNSTIC